MGSQWVLMGTHGYSWVLMGSQWVLMGSHGFSVGTQTVHFWVLRGFSGRPLPSALKISTCTVTSSKSARDARDARDAVPTPLPQALALQSVLPP